GARIERCTIIVADAREHRKIVGSDKHIDAVNLEEIHALYGVVDARPIRRALAPGTRQALRGKRDTPRLGSRKTGRAQRHQRIFLRMVTRWSPKPARSYTAWARRLSASTPMRISSRPASRA